VFVSGCRFPTASGRSVLAWCREVLLVAAASALAACGFQVSGTTEAPVDGPRRDAGVDAMIDPDATAGFTSRRRISWTGATEDHPDFPILVVLDATRIEYADVADDGSDLVFIDPLTSATLPHEIELWNEGGSSYVWVRVPLLDAADARSIWMYYGHASAQSPPAAAAVWSNGYTGVWHLGEAVVDEASTGTHADATGNGNTGAQRRNAPAMVAGGIGRVQEFDGNGDQIDIPQAGLQVSSATTIEVRAFERTGGLSYPHVLTAGSDGRFWQLFWDRDIGDAGWSGALRVANADERIRTASGSLAEWRSLAIVYSGTAVTLYMDGAPIGTSPAAGTLNALDTPLYLGANPILTQRYLDGYLDEVRISTVARSPAWLVSSHRAMTDTLLTYGPREAPP
jgi:hypothetical protein